MKYLEKFGGIVVFFTVILCIKIAALILNLTIGERGASLTILLAFISTAAYYLYKGFTVDND